MKSEYRQVAESVIAQGVALIEVTKLHADAAVREKQFSEDLQLSECVLAKYEVRVAELECVNASLTLQGVRNELK